MFSKQYIFYLCLLCPNRVYSQFSHLPCGHQEHLTGSPTHLAFCPVDTKTSSLHQWPLGLFSCGHRDLFTASMAPLVYLPVDTEISSWHQWPLGLLSCGHRDLFTASMAPWSPFLWTQRSLHCISGPLISLPVDTEISSRHQWPPWSPFLWTQRSLHGINGPLGLPSCGHRDLFTASMAPLVSLPVDTEISSRHQWPLGLLSCGHRDLFTASVAPWPPFLWTQRSLHCISGPLGLLSCGYKYIFTASMAHLAHYPMDTEIS
jgi:hypothetical protein